MLRAPSLCFAVFVYFNCYYNSLFGKKQEFLQDYGEQKNKQKSPNKKRPPQENQHKMGGFMHPFALGRQSQKFLFARIKNNLVFPNTNPQLQILGIGARICLMELYQQTT